jgi:poly(ADP-ribose) glycohydrolase ARH3
MLSRFRGTFLGVLAGDSIGALFEEGEILNASTRSILKNFINKLEGPQFKAPAIKFTDDSVLTKVVASNLLNYNEDYQKSLARGFTDQYFKDPYRSYGKGVIGIFNKLKASEFEDVTVFAKNQFDGTGSFGNGQ